MYRFLIDVELRAEYQGPGPWRSYYLVSQGVTVDDFVADAVIVEKDKDGGDLGIYYFGKADPHVLEEADEELHKAIANVIGRERRQAESARSYRVDQALSVRRAGC